MAVMNVLIVLALIAVVAVLGLGLYSLYRGGDFALANSNKLMRYRVIAQAVAIALIVIAFIMSKSHG